MRDSSDILALVLSRQETERVKMQPLFAYDLNAAAANDPRGEVVKTKTSHFLLLQFLTWDKYRVGLILSKVVPLSMGKKPLPPIQRTGTGVFLVEEAFNDEGLSFSSSSISSTSLEQEWIQEEGRRRSWVYQAELQNAIFNTEQIVETPF